MKMSAFHRLQVYIDTTGVDAVTLSRTVQHPCAVLHATFMKKYTVKEKLSNI